MYYYNKYRDGEVEKSIGCGTYKSDIHLLNDIINVITREIQSYIFYQNLSELTDNVKYRRILFNIQRDEVKHIRWANMILGKLNGKKSQVPEGEIPTVFELGLKMAIQDKVKTASFYRNIANRATNLNVYIYFTHMANEESRHKSCLEYMLYDLQSKAGA